MRTWLGWMALAALGAGCKPARPADAQAFAVAFVDAARAAGIDADWVDDAVILRIRRAQRLHNAAKAGAPADALAKAWTEDPLVGVPYEQKSKLQRDRAAHGIERSLHGKCDARDDEPGRKARVDAITAPIAGAPPDAVEELLRLGRDLSSAHLLRLSCDDGGAGLLVIPSRKSWQVVDVFPLGGLHMPIPK